MGIVTRISIILWLTFTPFYLSGPTIINNFLVFKYISLSKKEEKTFGRETVNKQWTEIQKAMCAKLSATQP